MNYLATALCLSTNLCSDHPAGRGTKRDLSAVQYFCFNPNSAASELEDSGQTFPQPPLAFGTKNVRKEKLAVQERSAVKTLLLGALGLRRPGLDLGCPQLRNIWIRSSATTEIFHLYRSHAFTISMKRKYLCGPRVK